MAAALDRPAEVRGAVDQAQESLAKNASHAIITGRLLPGGRTPVIVAPGLSRFPVRRFVPADIVACGVWAAIYSTLARSVVGSPTTPSGRW